MGGGRRERADSLSCEARNVITEVGEGGLGGEYGRLGEPDRVCPSTLPSFRPQGSEFLPVVVLSVCQLLCFPFALDVDADLLEGVLADLTDSEVTAHLLQVPGKPPRQEGGQPCVTFTFWQL